MKKLLLIFVVFFLSFSYSFACIPFSPSNLILGVYEGTYQAEHPENGEKLTFLNISHTQKPFAGAYNKLGSYYFFYESQNFSLDDYHPGDIIAIIADYNNGNYDDYFALYEMAKIEQKNGVLGLTNKQGKIKDWGKALWRCGNHKPKDVMDEKKLIEGIAQSLDLKIKKEENIFPFLQVGVFSSLLFILLGVFYLKKRGK